MDDSQRNGEADEGMNVWKERLMSGGWMNERERGGRRRVEKRAGKSFTQVSALPTDRQSWTLRRLVLTFNLTAASQWKTVSVRDHLGEAGLWARLWRVVVTELGRPA